MTLICILAESSVEIVGAGPHVEPLHESWPGWPLALDHFREFACPVPEVRAAAADLQIGVTVIVAPLVAPLADPQAATDRWTALSELRRAQDGVAWEIRLTHPFWRREST